MGFNCFSNLPSVANSAQLLFITQAGLEWGWAQMQSPADTAVMTKAPKFRSWDTKMTNFHFPAYLASGKARLEKKKTWFNNIFSCFPEALIPWWKSIKVNTSSGSTPTSSRTVSYYWNPHREHKTKFEHTAQFLLCSMVSDTDRSTETLHTQTYLFKITSYFNI